MISAIVSPGVNIRLVRLRAGLRVEPEERQYSSQVLDVMDDEILKIAVPEENDVPMPFEKGTRYQLIFSTGQGLYQCLARITERYKDGNAAVFELQMETDIEKYQNRQYYRLVYSMEIEYRILESVDLEEQKSEAFFYETKALWNMANLVDISGGGCRFYSCQNHKAGQNAMIRLTYIHKENRIDGCYCAKMIHSEPVGSKDGIFEHRVEFFKMDVWEREKLIKFIFEEERKIRRRERGLGR